MAWDEMDAKASAVAAAAVESAKGKNCVSDAQTLGMGAASVLAHQGITALFLFLHDEGPARKGPPSQKKYFADDVGHLAYGLMGATEAALPQGAPATQYIARSTERLNNVRQAGTDLAELLEKKVLLDRFFTYLKYQLRPHVEKEA